MRTPLTVNGLLMPPDFPTSSFERTYLRVRRRSATHALPYEHFTGAWNAVSFRFLTLCSEGDEFTSSITANDGASSLEQRYRQERHLFGLFSNGFSALESFFYGMFAIGSLMQPTAFPLATPKDQQNISPTSADRAFTRAFAGDAILGAFQAVFTDADYGEWRQIRNVLTHRTAPGRTIFVSIGSDEDLPSQWKINNIPLDGRTAALRRTHLARMLGILLDASATFVESHIT